MHISQSNSRHTSRRSFLKSIGAASAFTIVGSAGIAARPTTAFGLQGGADDTVLVSIFLRGGADGLQIVAPHGDDMLYTRRPTLAKSVAELNDLDGFFGLDPSFSALVPHYLDGRLAFVHAVGLPTVSRSHFVAQPLLDLSNASTGWLQRAVLAGSLDAQEAGLTIGSRTSPPLIGPASGRVVSSAERSNQAALDFDSIRVAVDQIYAGAPYAMDQNAVAQRLAAFDLAATLVPTQGSYPGSQAGRAMREAATMIKNDVGVRAVAVDLGGWDTHAGQAPTVQTRGQEFATALNAFHADLGSYSSKVVIVVMTEFGRTVNENASAGTDHGRGAMMMVMGDRLVDGGGGQVYLNGAWPGLSDGDLDPTGDLAVTTDNRDVMSELVSSHLGVSDLAAVFPGHTPAPLGLLGAVDASAGDVDQSGAVDDNDASMVLNDLVGNPQAGYFPTAGDIDGDGDTDLADALALAQLLAE